PVIPVPAVKLCCAEIAVLRLLDRPVEPGDDGNWIQALETGHWLCPAPQRPTRILPDVVGYFAAAGNAGNLPTSRASGWMITVALSFAAIFLTRSVEANVAARSVLKLGTPLVSKFSRKCAKSPLSST